MTARGLGVVLAFAAGCGHTHTIGPFVHAVSIKDGELLVERCILEQTSNNVTADSCTIEHHPLPMTAEPNTTVHAIAGIALAALAACGASSSHERVATKPAVLGETLTLDSKILGERRVINVYVPPDYAKSAARYPVLYMPDGGMAEDFPHVAGAVDVSIKNAVIRPVIVVGIENTVRRRDLVGPTTLAEERELAPQAGGADRFRAFLRDELKPMINARYRTTPESALIGESLAGLFVLETFIVEPTLFDGYIAADPSVWWNEQATVRSAGPRLAWWTAGAKSVYIATADYQETQDAVAILTTALRIHAPPSVDWVLEPMPHEHHNTIYPTAALHGIRRIFALPQ